MLDWKAGVWVLSPTLPPAPKRARARPRHPGPQVSPSVKPGDESTPTLRLLSALLLCDSKVLTIGDSLCWLFLSLEAGKDRRH